MNLRQLEAFKAVMEIGTVSQAAEIMRISQPAVSKLIAALEHDVGFSLFDRAKGRLVPTPEGEMLFNEVERAFVSTTVIARAAENIRDRKEGHLNIGATPALNLGFIQEVVARYLTDRPNVLISLHSRNSLEIVSSVASRQLDMGVTMAAIDNPGVETEPLCRVELVCVVPPDHRLANKDVIAPEDLQDEAFISLTSLDRTRQRIDLPMEQAGVRRNLLIETPMSYSACAFVAKGIGVAIVDPFSAHDFKAAPIVIKPFRPVVYTDIVLRFPFQRRRSMLIEEFVALLRGYLAERTDLPIISLD